MEKIDKKYKQRATAKAKNKGCRVKEYGRLPDGTIVDIDTFDKLCPTNYGWSKPFNI
jgi:hypothetical protein